MSKYTIVYVSDDMMTSCYGTFSERAAAEMQAERFNEDLDLQRDSAGGGAGQVAVCRIQPLRDWDA